MMCVRFTLMPNNMPKTAAVRVLGLDPGFGRLGFGIIERVGREWEVVTAGTIETSPKHSFVRRLVTIHDEVTALIKKYKPVAAAVEELFFAKNVTTGINVAQARGVVILTLAQAKVPIKELTPLEVKQALTGYGRAEKRQVEYMVGHLLKIKPGKRLKDDAYDALAIALAAAGGR